MFERAARLKLRFITPQGVLSVEEIWELPLSHTRRLSLDDVAVSLHHQLKRDTISFVNAEKPNPDLQLQFDIVKHIIDVKLDEQQKANEAHNKTERKQKILAIMAGKEEAELAGKSMDELRELVASL
jgi:hypothetical protein